MAILWANGYGAHTSWCFTVSTLAGMTVLVPSIISIGLYGVFISLVVQQAVYIYIMSHKTRLIRPGFSNDHVHIVGAILIVFLESIGEFYRLNLLSRSLLSLISFSLATFYFYKTERTLWYEAWRNILKIFPSSHTKRGARVLANKPSSDSL